VGTPDGIAAFQPPAEGSGKPASSEETGRGGSGEGPGAGAPAGSGSGGPSTSAGTGVPSTGSQTATSAGKPPIRLSELALTLKALIALDTSHPKVSQIAFTFTIDVAARVRASLERRVGRRGHARWRALTRPLTIAAVSGRNSRRLGGHGVLSGGAYRLTLEAAPGVARSIVFDIG
jgi:hypothetical protein